MKFNKLKLPTNKNYYEFFGTDKKSCGIAFYENEEQAMQDCKELIKMGVDLLPRVQFVETTKAIEIINERADNNFEFPMDSGDSFFKRK
jgi:hypothetical protein